MKKIRWITSFISILLIAGYAVFLAVMWKNIPETVATHFDIHGEANGFGSKTFLLVELAIMVGMLLTFAVVERFPSFWNLPVRRTEANAGRQILIGAVMLGIMKVLTISLIIHAGISSVVPGTPVWPMYVLLAMTAAVIAGGLIASYIAR